MRRGSRESLGWCRFRFVASADPVAAVKRLSSHQGQPLLALVLQALDESCSRNTASRAGDGCPLPRVSPEVHKQTPVDCS